MRRTVVLRNGHGDEVHGVEHQTEFGHLIDVNGTHWTATDWARNGWWVIQAGGWEG